ncbi:MAG TPA: hypothetical protein VNL91_08925 [Thermoanaerobaculia bacterium]|nr:hypothetical protein [Thermoanaerobaculia bacterium]
METKKEVRNEQQTPRPAYEPPRIQVMTEREILNTFQITQAMATWWVGCC